MATDWIKMRTDLYRDPKVLSIADALLDKDGSLARYVRQNQGSDMCVTRNVMRSATVGALVSLWGVARQRGERVDDDLCIENATLTTVDGIVDVEGFGDAMALTSWLEQTWQGLVFPGFFSTHNVDPEEKTRAKNRERQQRHRDNKRNATDNVTSNGCHAQSRVEKSRVEKKKEETPKPPSGAKYSSDFERFWSAFPRGRKTGKGNAWKSWKRICDESGTIELRETIIAAATEYAASPVGLGEYVKGPAAWLNGRCWEDDRAAWQRSDAAKSSPHMTAADVDNWRQK